MNELTDANAPDFDGLTPAEIAKAINAVTFDPESALDNDDAESEGL